MDYPKNSIWVQFQGLGVTKHDYHIWKVGKRWAWAALGHSGFGDNMEDVMRSARDWILYGVAGLSRTTKGASEARFVNR